MISPEAAVGGSLTHVDRNTIIVGMACVIVLVQFLNHQSMVLLHTHAMSLLATHYIALTDIRTIHVSNRIANGHASTTVETYGSVL